MDQRDAIKARKMMELLLRSYIDMGITTDDIRKILLTTALTACEMFAQDHATPEELTAELDDVIRCLQERKSKYV